MILKVDERLKNLFRSSFPSIRVVSGKDNYQKFKYQKYISIASLCKFYRNHTNEFMDSKFKSYKFNGNFSKKFRDQLEELQGLKIGISWRSFSQNNQKNRSLKNQELLRILNSSSNSFINLQ